MPADSKVLPPGPEVQGRPRGADCLWLVVALALVIVTGRAWLINTWGSALPFWDQWDVEPALYRAWLTDSLRLADLFAAHNEHRILFTRVSSLALFVLYDSWNPWAQLLLNAALHAATAAVLARVLIRELTPVPRAIAVAGIAVLFTATAGWQNALWGFQSQVYFTTLFAVLAFAGLAVAPPWSGRWWLGVGALVFSLFGNAAGTLAVVAALAVSWPPTVTRSRWTAWLLIAAVAVASTGLRVDAGFHAPLQARTIEQFAAVFARCLSWPHVDSPWWWMAVQLPLAALLIRRWITRTPLGAAERFAVGLVAFAVLQSAAVAFSRGSGLFEMRPLSRYQDPLLLGAAAHGFAALVLAGELGRRGRLACLGWATVMTVGLLQLTTTNLTLNLPYKRAQDAIGLLQVQTYLTDGNPAGLTVDPRHPGLHPDPKTVQRVLDDPVIRPMLPKTFFIGGPDTKSGNKPWVIRHGDVLFLVSIVGLGITLAGSLRGIGAARDRRVAVPTPKRGVTSENPKTK